MAVNRRIAAALAVLLADFIGAEAIAVSGSLGDDIEKLKEAIVLRPVTGWTR